MSAIPHTVIQLPSLTKYQALAVLATDVENLTDIKANLIKGNTQYDYGFVNAKNIVSLEQIRSAYYKVMVDERHDTMKTRTLHTEFIYALSPFKNIMDCLNKFGISKDSKTLLILKIVKSDELNEEYINENLDNLSKIVDGKFIDLTDENLINHVDVKVVEKNTKLKIRGTPLEGNWTNISRALVTANQLKGL